MAFYERIVLGLALKYQTYEGFLFAFLAYLLSFSLLLSLRAYAQEGSLTLEKEQNWTGCIPGGHNVFVKDVDDDGVLEIITGGFTYGGGMLRIWSWDGETLTLEKGHEWNTIERTSVYTVYASDVDGDACMHYNLSPKWIPRKNRREVFGRLEKEP